MLIWKPSDHLPAPGGVVVGYLWGCVPPCVPAFDKLTWQSKTQWKNEKQPWFSIDGVNV